MDLNVETVNLLLRCQRFESFCLTVEKARLSHALYPTKHSPNIIREMVTKRHQEALELKALGISSPAVEEFSKAPVFCVDTKKKS